MKRLFTRLVVIVATLAAISAPTAALAEDGPNCPDQPGIHPIVDQEIKYAWNCPWQDP